MFDLMDTKTDRRAPVTAMTREDSERWAGSDIAALRTRYGEKYLLHKLRTFLALICTPAILRHATQEHDDIHESIATLSVLLCRLPNMRWGWGREQCHMSKPRELRPILRRVAAGIRSSSSMNLHQTFVGGSGRFAIFPVVTVASPTMPEVNGPAISRRIAPHTARSSR